ncbi:MULTISPECIES: alpha/beta hydrolase [Ramlibacter]|uniref:Alpha/beta hydrolase fold domain-containing protein n=1 Tax=Ramlibacter pinisoli TaxID=2682844 RepID=A0A6N8IS91_9BURK|nr:MULTISPECIES: alpha/beta hydrolase [Ramlibacter]MBA2963776.1 alpha/beta hydrolase [Ramlibacter sp. CGMCC 1.13660]MVQ28743.1 alpha/beta hydrolase fold domain-containing protein [Ramlibacter pinisoli]
MAGFDGEWLDRMYNNRALVPEHPRHFQRWAQDSAQARDELPCELDLLYGRGPGETLDVFPAPGGKGGAPVVFFIHGGYWRSLDKREHAFVAPTFVQRGACVVLPNYALCPAVTIPQITVQMVRALAWTVRNVAQWGGDPSRITVIGHSAGGHLAAMLLACLWQQYDPALPTDAVTRALSISGLYDLEPLMHTPSLQADLRLSPQQVQQASPARLPPPERGALHTVVGADESPEFLRHNAQIREAWGDKRVPVCETLPGRNHFSVLEALVEPGHRLNQLALDLVAGT